MPAPTAALPRNRAVAVIAGALVVIVVAGTLSVLGWIKLAGGSSDGSAAAPYSAQATSAMTAGAQLALDFTAFDYRTLDANFASVAKRATPAFAKVYLSQSKLVEPAMKKAKAISTSQVKSTALAAFSPSAGTATVLVALNDTTKNTRSPAGTIQYFRMQVKMLRQHGVWLATGVSPE